MNMLWRVLVAMAALVGPAWADPGVTDTEIVLGSCAPLEGPASLPVVAQYLAALKKYSPEASPNFVSLEGFVNAMVLVEGLKLAGRNLSREKLVTAIEGIRDLDLGIGMKASYGPTRHHAFDLVYYTILRDGEPTVLTDWKLARR